MLGCGFIRRATRSTAWHSVYSSNRASFPTFGKLALFIFGALTPAALSVIIAHSTDRRLGIDGVHVLMGRTGLPDRRGAFASPATGVLTPDPYLEEASPFWKSSR